MLVASSSLSAEKFTAGGTTQPSMTLGQMIAGAVTSVVIVVVALYALLDMPFPPGLPFRVPTLSGVESESESLPSPLASNASLTAEPPT